MSAIHSHAPFVSVYGDDDYFQFAPPMSYHGQPNYDGQWAPLDSALSCYQFDHSQKPVSHDYASYQSIPFQYQHATFQINDGAHQMLNGWIPSMDLYRSQRYHSLSGPIDSSFSEASSDYAISPEVTAQQTTFSPNGYMSPPLEAHMQQQSWPNTTSYMFTPMSTPLSIQTPPFQFNEPEFPINPEFRLDYQEGETKPQIQISAPEELEISEAITSSIQSSQTSATFSSNETDSSVSTPARDHDSDSDFDPRRRLSRASAGTRANNLRSPRRMSSSYPTLDTNNRIHKQTTSRATASKEKCKPRPTPQATGTVGGNANNKAPKSFPCAFRPFGCSSTFGNKNEWKRHVTSQHLQLGFYRCDLGTCNPENSSQPLIHQAHGLGQCNRGRGQNKRRSVSNPTPQSKFDEHMEEVRIYNDFNRKDLFTQHCRRMHGPARHLLDNTTLTNQAINARLRANGRKPNNATAKAMATKDDEAAFEEELETIRGRCWSLRRRAPERSSCGFCGKLFEAEAHVGLNDGDGKAEERAWEERMEHLGKHYERDACSPEMEGIDPDLLEWGLTEGVLCKIEGVGAWLVGYELPSMSPTHSFGENEIEMGVKREGLRKRGPRRKVDASISVATASRETSLRTMVKMEDSDEDAMAEDD